MPKLPEIRLEVCAVGSEEVSDVEFTQTGI